MRKSICIDIAPARISAFPLRQPIRSEREEEVVGGADEKKRDATKDACYVVEGTNVERIQDDSRRVCAKLGGVGGRGTKNWNHLR